MEFLVSLFVGVGLFIYVIGVTIFSLLFMLVRSTTGWVRDRKWIQALILLAIIFWPVTWFGLVLTALVGAVFLLVSYIRAVQQVGVEARVGTKSSVKQLRP